MTNEQRNIPGDSLTIDCEQCTERFTTACSDCVVSFVLDRCDRRDPGQAGTADGSDAVVLNLAEARAVRLLADAGLVAPLRHRRLAVRSTA